MRKNLNRQSVVGILLLALFALLGWSCSHDEIAAGNDTWPESEVTAVDISYGSSRATNMDLETFSLSVYYFGGEELIADKFLYKQSGSSFVTDESFRQMNDEMKAIAVSPNMNILTSVRLDATNHYIDYVAPASDMPMLKIGANMSFTRKSTKNKLSLEFINAMALVNIRGRNRLEVKDKQGNVQEVDVIVQSVTLHNFGSSGRFTYTNNTDGDWEVLGYDDYTHVAAAPITMNKSKYQPIIDSTFVLIPQAPEDWAWTPAATDDGPATDALSHSSNAGKSYIELKCQITTQRAGETVYLWGAANSYKSIYVPYEAATRDFASINRQGIYNLDLTTANALDADGHPIKPEEADTTGDSFDNAVFIGFSTSTAGGDDITDDWEAETETTVITL